MSACIIDRRLPRNNLTLLLHFAIFHEAVILTTKSIKNVTIWVEKSAVRKTSDATALQLSSGFRVNAPTVTDRTVALDVGEITFNKSYRNSSNNLSGPWSKKRQLWYSRGHKFFEAYKKNKGSLIKGGMIIGLLAMVVQFLYSYSKT